MSDKVRETFDVSIKVKKCSGEVVCLSAENLVDEKDFVFWASRAMEMFFINMRWAKFAEADESNKIRALAQIYGMWSGANDLDECIKIEVDPSKLLYDCDDEEVDKSLKKIANLEVNLIGNKAT